MVLGRGGRIDARRHRGNRARRDRHVANVTRPVSGIDDVPAAQEQVVLRLGAWRGAEGRHAQCTLHDAQAEPEPALCVFHRASAVPAVACPSSRRSGTRPCRACPPWSSPVTVPANVKFSASPCSSPYALWMRTVSPSMVPVSSREMKSPWWVPSRSLAALPQVQTVRGRACRVVDAHVPLPGDIDRGGAGARWPILAGRIRQDLAEPVCHDLLLARREHVRRDRHAGLRGRRRRAPAKRAMRGSASSSVRATSLPRHAEAAADPTARFSDGVWFDSPSGCTTDV